MSMLSRAFHALRVWTGLADTAESHLTPDHGWLLPDPADDRRRRDARNPARGERPSERKAQA